MVTPSPPHGTPRTRPSRWFCAEHVALHRPQPFTFFFFFFFFFFPPPWTWDYCRRLDVLVQPEHVRRVVLVLQRDELRYVSSPYDDSAASVSPRKLTYARPVEASAAGAIDLPRPLDVRTAPALGSCQPVTALSRNGIDRSANAVSPSPTRATAPPIWCTWISDCGPGACGCSSDSRSISSSSRRARFVALKYAWMPFGQSGSISVWIAGVRHRPEQVGDRLGDRAELATSAFALLDRPGARRRSTPPPSSRATPPGSPAAAARSSG